MRMSHATMYARLLAGDPSFNGRFFTGVLTTGIYCLPSCKARKPKPENVRFFPTCEAARAAGLRACRKCHPDDFARGADPVLADIETLVAELRANPAAFPDVRSVVRRSGFGATRLFELLRLHYHATPADLLLRARIAVTKRALLTRDHGLLQIANDAGFESLSAFHDQFRRLNGLTPATYRELGAATGFTLALPDGYPLGYLRRALSRDPHSATERLEGDHYTTVVQLSGGPAVIMLELAPDAVRVEVADPGNASISYPGLWPQPKVGTPLRGVRGRLEEPSLPRNPRAHARSVKRVTPSAAQQPALRHTAEAHAIVIGLLGLDQDAAGFARLARKLGLARLVAGRPELRIAQTPSVFDGVIWSIIGQQINFPFACLLKRRLIERTGRRIKGPSSAAGLYAPPRAADVAALDPAELLPLQFSRQKADYVVATARLVVEGKLDLEALRSMSATRAERTLMDVRGLGPWSVNYLMMRSLGFADCVPLGDTGITSGLLDLLKLDERPDVDATRRLMAVFSPYRSLATAHLWQLNQPIPA